MDISKALTQIGNVLSLFGEDSPDVFKFEHVLHERLEMFALTEEGMQLIEVGFPRGFALGAEHRH